MFLNNLDIIFIQEHNVKAISQLDYIEKHCFIVLNSTFLLKGGTAIFLNRNSQVKVLKEEMDVKGHIVSVKCSYLGKEFQLLNVYAPSGKDRKKEREELFQNDLLFYMRNNLRNVIIGGDWNCITCFKDCSNLDSHLISKALQNVKDTLKLKDVWCLTNHIIEYTYVRDSYGSRLDRIYVKDLEGNVSQSSIMPVSWSDHNAVKVRIKVDDNLSCGRGYWKLNCNNLKHKIVKANFEHFWKDVKNKLKRKECQSILEWWDETKVQLKIFFKEMSKIINQERFGLLNLLKSELRIAYNNHSINCNSFNRIRELKERIAIIEDEICEGVRIRARVEERLNGEKISTYLLGKEKNAKTRIVKLNSENGMFITDAKAIQRKIVKYYRELYDEDTVDQEKQESFLCLIEPVIDDQMNKVLTAEVTESEVWKAINSMKYGKCPGLDGLSVEFYKIMWCFIKEEFLKVINFSISNFVMSKDSNSGVIKLIPKSGNPCDISNWRPITMLNVDYKIMAKILVNRIKPLLDSFISREQFCAIPGRSINNCNTLIRDIIYYLQDENVPAAFVNLDWSKAFDRINLDFLFKIMVKFGFSSHFVNLIRMLYNDAKSTICVNGNLTETFPIKKSVRQGCPLSMILYILAQEPLYRMLKQQLVYHTPELPNNLKTSVLGFADDSTFIINTDQGIIESLKVTEKYELASGARLNREKTSIIGLGNWNGRTNWPVTGLKVMTGSFKILGVTFHNEINEAIRINWMNIEQNIVKYIGVLYGRKLTLFQRTLILNSKVLSKAWYISQVYPMPSEVGKRLEQYIFKYIWHGNYQPINRKTMYLRKCDGGSGIINVAVKARVLFFMSCYKCIVNRLIGVELIAYFCQNRFSYLIDFGNLNCSTIMGAPYYNDVITMLRTVVKMEGYPCLKSKQVYWFMITDEAFTTKIESNYPLFNWKIIWENLNNKWIDAINREILFKYIHEVLATKDRLFMMSITDNHLCRYCGEPENIMHLVYFCSLSIPLVTWMKNLLVRVCNIKTGSFLRILKLDFIAYSKRDRNTAVIMLSDYISGIWYGHKLGLLTDDSHMIDFIKGRMLKNRYILCKILGNNLKNVFTEKYCQLEVLM